MTDRAPSEVETVALARASRALDEVIRYFEGRLPPAGFPLASLVKPAADDAHVALDAVRGRSRDDTVTLAEDERAALEHVAKYGWRHRFTSCPPNSRQMCPHREAFDRFLARFGAGRAEDKPPPAKDPTQ